MRPLADKHLFELIPYVPGKPIEETEREYGVSHIAKLASNENCLGPSPKAVEAMTKALRESHLYPDADCFYLKEKLCERHQAHGVGREHLVVGNGTNELLVLLVRALVGEGEAVAFAWPSFVVYRLAAKGCGRAEVMAPLRADHAYDLDGLGRAVREDQGGAAKVVFLANPNNPTGTYIGQADFDRFVEGLPADVVLVVDEAYAEYVTAPDYPDGLALAMKRPRTVVTRTFSKIFGLAAQRVGYAVCDPEIADILNRLRDPFNVNAIAQRGATAAIDDTEHVERAREHNARELPRLAAGLTELGLTVTPSQANFVLAELAEGMPDLRTVDTELLKRAVILRPVANYGIQRGARITVGTAAENQRLLTALGEVLR